MIKTSTATSHRRGVARPERPSPCKPGSLFGFMICIALTSLLSTGTAQAAESVSTLVYEGFSASASGAGDDYQIDVTLRAATDARTGFTGAWSNPGVASGLDFWVRSTNMVYENFVTGTDGALEIYESRAGQNPANRSIFRDLSYITPATNDIFFVFGWATADAAAVNITLASPVSQRNSTVSVTAAGVVTVTFPGASAINYTSADGAAATDGSWNLLVIRAMHDPGDPDPLLYDTAEIWLNPTIASGNGELSQLGTPSGTGRGIIRKHSGGGTPVSFNRVTFQTTVGTGMKTQFDEFHITTDPSDFLFDAPPAGTLVIIR